MLSKQFTLRYSNHAVSVHVNCAHTKHDVYKQMLLSNMLDRPGTHRTYLYISACGTLLNCYGTGIRPSTSTSAALKDLHSCILTHTRALHCNAPQVSTTILTHFVHTLKLKYTH
jgi:hypothetical protein